MAEYTSRFVKERNMLKDVIPLKTPYQVGIHTGDFCNLKCHFCQHSLSEETFNALNLSREFMTLDTLKKIVDDLKEFPEKIKMLQFSSMGEPTLNCNLPQMIKYAKEAGIADVVKVVTNGLALNHDLADELINAGIDRIEISLQGYNEEMYERNAKTKINFSKFLDNLTYLYNIRSQAKIYMQTVDSCLIGGENREKFIETFEPICDYINISEMLPVDIEVDYSKYLDVEERLKQGWKDVCPQMFYTMFCMPDGEVIPCCHERRGRKISLGNIHDNTLKEIWNGNKRKTQLLFQLYYTRREIEVCRTCISPNVANEIYDNLDNDRENIIEQIKEKEVMQDEMAKDWS